MKAVMYGAGSIGRGFMAQLFCESGYDTVFIDVNTELIDRINEAGEYPLCFVDNDFCREIRVKNVSGIYGQDRKKISEVIAGADVMATSLGKSVLPNVAEVIAEGLRLRMSQTPEKYLNIIVCENMIRANEYLKELVQQYMTPEEIAWMDEHIGMVETCIGRNVPVMTPELWGDDPLRVLAEDYSLLPVDKKTVRGPLPKIKNMEFRDEFGFYIRQKLFMYNMAHAVIGYSTVADGLLKLSDAVRIPEVKYLALKCLAQISEAMAGEYGRDFGELFKYSRGLLKRFENRRLGISVPRLCAEPLRKVSEDDRMTGAALLCMKHGIVPSHICAGIAYAYAFDDPRDAQSAELQEYLKANGIERAVERYSRLPEDSPLAGMICRYYRMVTQGSTLWQIVGSADEEEFEKI
jgi:mannitol-1-phosphate 5-dehydrogenase